MQSIAVSGFNGQDKNNNLSLTMVSIQLKLNYTNRFPAFAWLNRRFLRKFNRCDADF
jgi:hypothetical protein